MNHGIESIIFQWLSSPPARNRRVRPGEGGVWADWAWSGSSNADQAWVAQIRCPARISRGESPWNHCWSGTPWFFQFLRGDSKLDLDPANLSRLELHRSSLLLESMTENCLQIILGPPGFSLVKHQNLIIQKCCHRSNNLVSEAWCRTTGLAWINVTASCLLSFSSNQLRNYRQTALKTVTIDSTVLGPSFTTTASVHKL